MTRAFAAAGVARVGIERSDGPVVDSLLSTGFEVFVIPPSQLKNLRSRYGSAGNKDDSFDAYVLADVVRTDHHRLRALQPDSPATTALRSLVRSSKTLVQQRVALANQLRAHLQIAHPGAVGLFSALDGRVSLRFLTRFTTQEQVDWLSVKRLDHWLRGAGYSGRGQVQHLYDHLGPHPGESLASRRRPSPRRPWPTWQC